MAKTFKLMLATPEGWVARDDAESLIVPGVEGYLGILANHAPLMTALAIGSLTYRDSAGYDHIFAVTDGFLEVSKNVVTIIADSAETADKIDIDRAKSALERAKQRLDEASTNPDIDVERARAAYRRALNRIKIAESSVSPAGSSKIG
jgi:F-type H+-transporting ATPase subunit epsilon